MALAWGAAESADQAKAARVSVLVGPDGKVVRVWDSPDPATHAGDVVASLDA